MVATLRRRGLRGGVDAVSPNRCSVGSDSKKDIWFCRCDAVDTALTTTCGDSLKDYFQLSSRFVADELVIDPSFFDAELVMKARIIRWLPFRRHIFAPPTSGCL